MEIQQCDEKYSCTEETIFQIDTISLSHQQPNPQLEMLKFKKTGGTPVSSPAVTPTSSTRKPKLLTRLDSIGRAVKPGVSSPFLGSSASVFELTNKSSSSSEGEFETPGAKLQDIAKKKLNKEKKLKKKSGKNATPIYDLTTRQDDIKLWVKETAGKDLSKLSKRKQKQYISQFIDKWNKKALPQKYYWNSDPMSLPTTSPASLTTSHLATSSSSLWMTPPSVLPEEGLLGAPSADDDQLFKKPPAVSSVNSQSRFATVTRSSARKPSQLCFDEMNTFARSSFKPTPPRRAASTVITSISAAFGSSESISTIASTSSLARVPQPRMGSAALTRRRSRVSENAQLPDRKPPSTGRLSSTLKSSTPSPCTSIAEDPSEPEIHTKSATPRLPLKPTPSLASASGSKMAQGATSTPIAVETKASSENQRPSTKRRSGEKRPIADIYDKTVQSAFDICSLATNWKPQSPKTRRAKTIWAEEVQKCDETFL